MDLTAEQFGQLIAAMVMVVLLFSAAMAAPMRVSIAVLLVLMPFQAIETQYGSANVVVTYALFGALLFSGRRLRFPMLGYVLTILLTYLLSMSQTHEATYMQHGIYLFLLCSGFVVFYLAYNFGREESAKFAVNVLIVSNIWVLLVCVLQVYSGITERFTLFGLEELRLHRVRSDDRVVGPFGAAGITAEYLMLMIFILAHDLHHAARNRRLFVLALIAANLAALLSTANRGAFLTMLGIFPIYLYVFRRELGARRLTQISVAATVLLAIVSVVMISYSGFGRMFERLAQLRDLEGFIPETRQVTWPVAWENIQNKPLIGHGPRLRLQDDSVVAYPGHVVIPYPHSLYLHLLFTVGIVGTVAFLAFFAKLGWQLMAAGRAVKRFAFTYETGLVKLSPLLLLAFLIDQIKIEFLREGFVDYAHVVFALFGITLGWAHRQTELAHQKAPAREPLPEEQPELAFQEQRPATLGR